MSKTPRSRRGTCPVCGKRYQIKENGFIRRHHSKLQVSEGRIVRWDWEKCFQDDLLPREILGAVIVIARMDVTDNERENHIHHA